MSRTPGHRCTSVLAVLLLWALPAAAANPPDLPAICDGLVPIPLQGKPVVFKDTVSLSAPGFEKWVVRGKILPFPSFVFDPAAEPVTVVLTQDTDIFSATVPAGTFEVGGSPRVPRWKFRLRRSEPDIPGGEGWRVGRFRAIGGPLNKIPFAVGGDTFAIPLDPAFQNTDGETTVRFTLRAGDLCATNILNCVERASGRIFRCFSQPEDLPSSASGAFLDPPGRFLP